jgi:hypothetical protein
VSVATGPDDVQRTYMILSPRGKAAYRLIVIAQKRLPAVGRDGDRKAGGFVEKTSSQRVSSARGFRSWRQLLRRFLNSQSMIALPSPESDPR